VRVPTRARSSGLAVALLLPAIVAVTAVVPRGAAPVAAVTTVSCTAPVGAATPPPTTGGFVGLVPERLVDTRQSAPVPANCWLRVDLPASVPAGATAVAVTVTSDRAAAPGFLTVHPCGSALPEHSNLNVRPSGPTSNMVIVAVDATRQMCVYSDRGTDVIVDLVGHFGAGGDPFHEFAPQRVIDTRDAARRPAGVVGKVLPGQTAGVEHVTLGVPDAATAVVVNLTVTQADAYGYLTAFPCGSARPNTSNVNYDVGVDRANTTVMALGPQGSLCFETAESAAHVIVDVIGWFGDSPDADVGGGIDFRPGAGRVADSRNGMGGWTGPFAAGTTRSFDPAATGVLPDGTRVAVLGVVATQTAADGFLSVRPCGDTSEVSSLNFVRGVDITNLVTVPIADDGRICVFTSAATHIVVDVFGGFRADGAVRALDIGSLALQPPFEADITDYVTYCPSQTANAFSIFVRGMPGTTVEIVGAGSGSPVLSVGIFRDADQLIQLRVTPAGGAPTDYWIRCLPPDFPKITTTRLGPTPPGWYLMTTSEFGIIADEHGVPVWYRRAIAPARNPRNLMRLGPNELTWFEDRGFALGNNPDDGYERFTLGGTPIGIPLEVGNPLPTNHHDMVPLSNGNFLVMAMPSVVDSETCHVNPAPFPQVTSDRVAGAVIQEITAGGAVVKHFDAAVAGLGLAQNTVPLCFRDPATTLDYLTSIHINGMSAAGDLVVFSARHHDAVYGVGWSSGSVDWKLGGTAPDDPIQDVVIVNDLLGGPLRPHDPQIVQTGPQRYRLTMFDNRTPLFFANPPGTGPARYVEYDLNTAVNPPIATLIREIRRANGNSSGALGSARLQPDGGVVINWGAVPGPVFSEYGPSDQLLYELSWSPFDPSYRTIKEPANAFDRTALRTAATALNT
jgi:Arylsulfotransferase (ASST)